MTNFFLVILIILYYFEHVQTQYYPYKHYSRHPTSENIYDNETINGNDDDSNMCHITVRCPTVPNLCNAGPRGAVGPQGEMGRSKQVVPIVAFVAYLQKMLSIEPNRSEPIIFEKTDINEGNYYNQTTGIFTAAYRGIYKFSITIMAQMDSIATVRIVRNRNNILGMIRCDCRRRFSHVRASVYAELDVNDQIMAEALGDLNDSGQAAPRNNIYGYTYTHFSGVLVFLTDNLSLV
ncbi:unnamed protein product [Rotaria magnacalcarata]|uniref:C1q domain-containing protein n=1 Tax=Rotaria magnacalcarata TaxID=392030 RepID=A0A8S2IVT6_9BILA|nr:unnamed protein product [Rotaria magnacalcarata]